MTLKELNEFVSKHGYNPDTLNIYALGADIKYIGLSKDTMCLEEDSSVREDYEKFIEIATGDDMNEIDRIINNLECIHDNCKDCPHWTGKTCDGNISEDE